MSKFLAGLNPEQQKAVTAIKGPVLVLAGAGTGKTRVITHRIAHMISQGIPSTSILAMTFTNKAAGEMRERICGLVPRKSVDGLTVGTFHSFCARSLRQFADEAGIRRNFGICDEDDQFMAIKQAMRELRIPEKTLPPRVCMARISLLKNRLVGARELARSGNEHDAMMGRILESYNRGLQSSGVLDFDDLLLCMVKLLKDAEVLGNFRKRYRHLLIDEYQDTNGPQYEIVRQIGGGHRNVFVVGDDDQSIYGWRGADVSKILNFENDFPEATVVRLETNYRSTEQILESANRVIRNNGARHEKTLRSAAGGGTPVRIMHANDEQGEAELVVFDILERVQATKAPLGDFAVLFRTAVQPRIFEMHLRQRHVPYNLVGGMSFFDRKEVRDVLAYLRLIANPADELSLLRVINTPPRGVGMASVEKALDVAARERIGLGEVFLRDPAFAEIPSGAVVTVREFLGKLRDLQVTAKKGDLVELVKRTVGDVKYAEEIARCYPDEETRTARWDAINEIMNMAEQYVRRRKKPVLAEFLADLTLSANDEEDDDSDRKPDRVTLMTLHSAKGLEFNEVYLVGMEEGILPHAKSIQDGAVEEERRLAYVGITRARRRLTMTCAISRAKYGKRVTSVPSRFLYESVGKTPPPSAPPVPARPGKQRKRGARVHGR